MAMKPRAMKKKPMAMKRGGTTKKMKRGGSTQEERVRSNKAAKTIGNKMDKDNMPTSKAMQKSKAKKKNLTNMLLGKSKGGAVKKRGGGMMMKKPVAMKRGGSAKKK